MACGFRWKDTHVPPLHPGNAMREVYDKNARSNQPRALQSFFLLGLAARFTPPLTAS